MFQDPDFQMHSAVDKRGRQVAPQKKHDDLRRFYRLKDEQVGRTGRGGRAA